MGRNNAARWTGAVALAAVGAAIAQLAATWSAEKAHPPAGRFVSTGSGRLHYLEAGQGPCVALIHGNLVNAEDWRIAGVFDDLALQRRVLAFDRPGCGYSSRGKAGRDAKAQARAIADALQKLEAAPAVIVGHSVGAQVAAHLALDFPDLVRGLVLVSGYYFPTLRIDAALASFCAAPVAGDVLRATALPAVQRLAAPLSVEHMFSPLRPPRGFVDFPYAFSLRPTQLKASMADGGRIVREARVLSTRLKDIAAPTVVVASAVDNVVDPGQSRRAAEEIPGARLEQLGPLGHMAHHGAPGRIAEAALSLSAPAGLLSAPAKSPPSRTLH